MSATNPHPENDAETASFVENRRAPSYEALRPLKPPRSDTFPVYSDLADRLVHEKPHPDDDVRFVLAVCAGYSYSDAATIAMIVARLGLEECVCRMVGQYVDAMLIDTTAYVIQSADGRVVIVSYRGTVPMSGINWLTDLDVTPHRISLTFPHHGHRCDVHGGFYRNVRATRPDVIRCLDWALHGQSVLGDRRDMDHPLEVLYLTGHSYGGAMATLLAVMLRAEPAYEALMDKLRAVYTFGAPMVGSPALARACQDDELGHRLFRFVYDNDIVPQVPPKVCGEFEHFGAEYRYTPASGWDASVPREQLGGVLDVLSAPTTFVARQLRLTRNVRFHASLYDHLPGGYITALTPGGVTSEFGS